MPASKLAPRHADVLAWLNEWYGSAATELAPLRGGYWSSAYSFTVNGEHLVLRLGAGRQGFDMDRRAEQFRTPDLPIPEVLAIGEAFDGWFAVSRRHYGRFIETLGEAEAPSVRGALDTLLQALRAEPWRPEQPVTWYRATADDPGAASWQSWLADGLRDDPARLVSGWRARLAESPRIENVFQACEDRIRELLPACPERRDLVHGDLLHQNVLVNEAADRVTAVFSWKCSVRGDFLYDVAWCTFWGPWHPAIAAADAWQLTWMDESLSDADLADAPLRHHCYELQIAATHLAWTAWTQEETEMAAVADRALAVLERGALTLPRTEQNRKKRDRRGGALGAQR